MVFFPNRFPSLAERAGVNWSVFWYIFVFVTAFREYNFKTIFLFFLLQSVLADHVGTLQNPESIMVRLQELHLMAGQDRKDKRQGVSGESGGDDTVTVQTFKKCFRWVSFSSFFFRFFFHIYIGRFQSTHTKKIKLFQKFSS